MDVCDDCGKSVSTPHLWRKQEQLPNGYMRTVQEFFLCVFCYWKRRYPK